jgi:multidrug resistance efflux pump
VRLAQRIPVSIHIDGMPPGVVLSAGMTATVQIDESAQPSHEALQLTAPPPATLSGLFGRIEPG